MLQVHMLLRQGGVVFSDCNLVFLQFLELADGQGAVIPVQVHIRKPLPVRKLHAFQFGINSGRSSRHGRIPISRAFILIALSTLSQTDGSLAYHRGICLGPLRVGLEIRPGFGPVGAVQARIDDVRIGQIGHVFGLDLLAWRAARNRRRSGPRLADLRGSPAGQAGGRFQGRFDSFRGYSERSAVP